MKIPTEIFLVLLFCLSGCNGLVVRSNNKRTRHLATTLHSTTEDVDIDVAANQARIASLPLPPSRSPGPFRGLRESISHLSNNCRFVRKRADELGDVFLTNVFFQPTVIIGGQEAVQEFVSGTELKSKVIHCALPDSFQELHTKWGTLNLDANDIIFKQGRELFAGVFSVDGLKEYTPIINEAMDLYLEGLVDRVKTKPDEEIQLVPELKALNLRTFSKIFSGEGLTDEQVQMFEDYNSALLALPFEKKKLEKGAYALETLKEVMLSRYQEFQQGNPTKANHFFFTQVSNREGWVDDRVCTAMVLFIWGAYIETASLMVNSMTAINKYNPDYVNIILEEVQAEEKKDGASPLKFSYWSNLEQTLGVLRESLRLIPPGGGTPRYSEEDFELLGYRIPAGTAVMLDPRVGETDPKLFTDPNEFKPTRWVPETSSSSTSKCPFQGTALKLGFGSWFPGGFGAHQCPGVPLSELTSKMFLTKTIKAFNGWSFGKGTKRNGEVKFVEVPIKIPVDELGVKFSLR